MSPDPKDEEAEKQPSPTPEELAELEKRLTYGEGDLILEYDPADEDDGAEPRS